jgi:hypothetical protein
MVKMMQEKTEQDLIIELHDIARQLEQMGYDGGKLVIDLRDIADRLSKLALVL